MKNLLPGDRLHLKLLALGAFERRQCGGWRFGTKAISTTVVDRLIASGRAEIVNDRLQLLRTEPAE